MRAMVAVAVAALVSVFVVATPQPAGALSASEFDPGYIISDAQFYDGNAMTEAQIQSFLTAASGSCQNSYCLAVHHVATTTTSAGFGGCATYQGAADESAARIIFKVQQACGISAKVLLVTLQKEQGLVTKSAPTSAELRKAMGQGCPDTSDCDANYYGLQKQLYFGSRQLTWYGDPQGSFTSIKLGQVNNIQYHPNAGCGTGPVTVRNKATAALYYYTPYQPNTPALANIGGLGDSCSSYGNRNFWVYFNDWFGSPTGYVDPLAHIDSAALVTSPSKATIDISGWAMDRAALTRSIAVHIYVDQPDGSTVGYPIDANGSRPDVAAAYGGAGPLHGYSASIPVKKPGTYRACVFPITSAGGWLLGCQTFVAQGATPTGVLDSVIVKQLGGSASIAVSGWALDTAQPSTSIQAHVYIDRPDGTSKGSAVTADADRPDIAQVYTSAGSKHGFQTEIPIAATGTYRVCVFAVAQSPFGQAAPLLDCKVVSAKASAPAGVLDSVQIVTEADRTASIKVAGWAFDSALPSASMPVHIYVDRPNGTSSGTAVVADEARVDIGRVFPEAGPRHGFSLSSAVQSRGSYRVCAFGIGGSVFGAANSLLGCKSVTTEAPPTFGALDSVSVSGTGSDRKITASGWAADPSAVGTSIETDVYFDRPDGTTAGVAVVSDSARPDVARAFPGYSQNRGYVASVSAIQPGVYKACAFAISGSLFGSNSLLGCSAVTVK